MDRGSAQAIGLVTDIGIFLPQLVEEIDKQKAELVGKGSQILNSLG
jgi:hypothetical protein